MSRPEYEIILADTPDLVQACYDIRIQVFVAEQGFSIDDEMDHYDDEDGTVHMLLNVLQRPADGQGKGPIKRVPVGVVRIITSKNKLGRLAILPGYRSYGFGKLLVQGVHDWARAQLRGPDETVQVVLHAQMHAIPFYAKCGYRPEGEPFDEDGAPHQRMVVDIRRAGKA